jgi:hypothetical protein
VGRKRHQQRGPKRTSFILDVFTETDIERWSSRSADAQRYSDYGYFDLERQRVARYDELCDSLRSAGSIEVDIGSWTRITDYRWSLEPLSSIGSLKGIGGRFNIGQDLDRARAQFFPALYIAENLDTAFCEFFGGPLSDQHGPLNLQEFALRRATSFTTFALRGKIENVFDLTASTSLHRFAGIVSRFQLSADTRRFARQSASSLTRSLSQRIDAKAALRAETLARRASALWHPCAESNIWAILARCRLRRCPLSVPARRHTLLGCISRELHQQPFAHRSRRSNS